MIREVSSAREREKLREWSIGKLLALTLALIFVVKARSFCEIESRQKKLATNKNMRVREKLDGKDRISRGKNLVSLIRFLYFHQLITG